MGTCASSLERPQTHTGHRHCLLGWPLLFSRLSPANLPVQGESCQHVLFVGLRACISLEAFPASKWAGQVWSSLGVPRPILWRRWKREA